MSFPSIISVGELLVEFISHQKGCELRALSRYSGPYPSGAPAICIDQAAKIGASTQIFGAVGADNFGNALLDRLQYSGVETSGISKLTNKTTGVAFVSYFDDGSRTFIFHLNNTAADEIPLDSIQLPPGPLIMHFSGSSLGNPKLRAAIEHTAKQVINRGGHLSCDPNARPELMSDPTIKAVLTRLIEKSSYLFPSDSDLEFVYPSLSQKDAIKGLFEKGVKTIALTCGDQGSVIYTKQKSIRLGGYAVEEIDPTGAGDCFCGTFLAMMIKGHSIEKCGQYANAAGALAVTKRGPMEGNSNLDTIEAFIKNNPVK
jgi:sugar/nucleoside kinase (ribokinase family)